MNRLSDNPSQDNEARMLQLIFAPLSDRDISKVLNFVKNHMKFIDENNKLVEIDESKSLVSQIVDFMVMFRVGSSSNEIQLLCQSVFREVLKKEETFSKLSPEERSALFLKPILAVLEVIVEIRANLQNWKAKTVQEAIALGIAKIDKANTSEETVVTNVPEIYKAHTLEEDVALAQKHIKSLADEMDRGSDNDTSEDAEI